MSDKSMREDNLRRFLGQHGPVWITVTGRSKSGMTRRARVFCVYEGNILDITYSVSVVADLRLKKDTGEIVIGGCGFSVQNHIAVALSRSLHGEDYAIKYHCL